MDPNAALQVIHDALDGFDREEQEAAHSLYQWIARGGFEPDWSRFPEGTRRYRRILLACGLK